MSSLDNKFQLEKCPVDRFELRIKIHNTKLNTKLPTSLSPMFVSSSSVIIGRNSVKYPHVALRSISHVRAP